jgi:hypothetical protein
VRALERRLARIEAARRTEDDALVRPETLQRMAAANEAECARIREKLLGGGPCVPVAGGSGVESEAHAILREKLLRDDPQIVEPARA